jgi:hypothetical protein
VGLLYVTYEYGTRGFFGLRKRSRYESAFDTSDTPRADIAVRGGLA